MKKIILSSVILIAFVFYSAKSSSPGCYALIYIGSSLPHSILYTYHDYGSDSVTINIDTTYNFGAVINDTLIFSEGGIHCTTCTPYNVIAYSDTGLNILHFTTCLNTAVTINFHVMRKSSLISISEISNLNALQIYPNPTDKTFIIKNIPFNEISLLQIINSFGEVVQTEKLFGKNEYEVTADFAKGIYYVHLGNTVKKLVVE